MYAVGPKIIASYYSESLQIDFIKSADKIFAATILNGLITQYPVDASLSTIQAIPNDLRPSTRKTIRWLLENHFLPCIQNDAVIFCVDEPSQEDCLLYLDRPFPQELDPLPQDIEGYYLKQLLHAKREEHPQYQIYYLEKLSDLFLQKQNWPRAATLLNAALAILEKELDHPSFRIYLLERLEKIEALFLKSHNQEVSNQHRGSILNFRTWLANIRAERETQIQTKHIQDVLYELTSFYKLLLGTLILDSQQYLGPVPTQWACIGLGSMARDEMCPYSDLEFAFVIKEKTPEILHYFRILTELIEIRIINLGETKFPIFAHLFGEAHAKASPNPGGFSLDRGGNTPLGKPGWYELIDTPEGLAQYQCTEWMNGDIILTHVLSSVCYVAGDQDLAQTYHNLKEDKLNTKDGAFSFLGIAFREKLALNLFNGNIQEFKPDLSKKKEETKAFGIKQELYRPLQSILGSLKLFYGLQTSSTFSIIQQLLAKNILSQDGAKNLTEALSQVLTMRFKAHVFYQNEEEFLLHIDAQNDAHNLYLTEELLEPLYEIYKVLIPLYQCAEQFIQKQESKTFRIPLYDENPLVQAAAYIKMLQYDKAHEACQQAVSLNPNNIDALLALGEIENIMGKHQEALPRNLKALALSQQKYGENHPSTIISYNNLGANYTHLCMHDTALEFYQKALKIGLSIFKENHFSLSNAYNNIGLTYNYLGDYFEALKAYQTALHIKVSIFGENHHELVTTYNNIAAIYDELKEYDKAAQYYLKTTQILLSVNENHPDIAINYNNIGAVFYHLGEYSTALRAFEKALTIWLPILGKNHPCIAASYHNIGLIYDHLGEYYKAFKLYQKTLKILSFIKSNNISEFETILRYLINCADKIALSDRTHLHETYLFCVRFLGEEHILVKELLKLLSSSEHKDL